MACYLMQSFIEMELMIWKKSLGRGSFLSQLYNQFQNILRLFDVLPKFPLTTSETMGDYYL